MSGTARRRASWAKTLAPMEAEAVARIMDWLPKLTKPIRTGEHSQTAFAFGLALDWARLAKHAEFERLLVERSRAFYLADRACPMAYEPSGQDFVSPCLAEADLMRRVLPAAEFSRWLGDFLPQMPTGTTADASWLEPGVVLDKTDGKLAHLDGLNLSRAWMLEGILSALPAADPRRPALTAAAARASRAGPRRRHRRALRRRPLARHVRGLPHVAARPDGALNRSAATLRPSAVGMSGRRRRMPILKAWSPD